MSEQPREGINNQKETKLPSIEEIKESPFFVCLELNGEKFYFDSSALDQRQNEQALQKMLDEGWQVTNAEELPAYAPIRRVKIQEKGLTESGWGYK